MEIEWFFDEIERQWPQPDEPASKEIVDLCFNALREHPKSSTLWYDLGILMQRCPEGNDYKREDYLQCFESAVKCNPNNWEAQQELGYILDNFFDDYARAEQAFRKAIEFGAGVESYYGLARVLAQMGKSREAIHVLSKETCPFYDDDDVQTLRAEIIDGVWYWEEEKQGEEL